MFTSIFQKLHEIGRTELLVVSLPFVSALPASGTFARTGEVVVSPKISFAVFRISAQSLKMSSLVVLKL